LGQSEVVDFPAMALGHRPDWDPNTRRTQMAVEVGDVDGVYAGAERRGLRIVYPITDEPWGIRRFFVEDPDGTVINVHSHLDKQNR
jgi:uncharacterized glyoxalase superfamily protein PhnB